MAWNLRIVHFDVDGAGDATLFHAVDTARPARQRAVLIDGGLKGAMNHVYAGIGKYAIGDLDVMVATHYDKDHLEGLTHLLATDCYTDLRIYDPGEIGQVRDLSSVRTIRTRRDDGGYDKQQVPHIAWDATNRDNGYVNYLNAITRAKNAGRTINRLTECVMSDKDREIPQNLANTFHEANVLLGREIMWETADSLFDDPDDLHDDGRPTLTCIAANQFVLDAGGDPVECEDVANDFITQQNARSLGFLLEFGNFRYYVGGDLETAQEDDLIDYFGTVGDGTPRFKVFKTSHHGSENSTSDAFVAATDPEVAIISCGDDNQHFHPRQSVVDILEAHNVDYFLTGNGWKGLNVKGRGAVAGQPGRWGDISVTVTEAGAADGDFDIIYLRRGGQAGAKTTERYRP